MEFNEEITPKCGENCPISGQRKKCRILSHLWLSWVFLVPTFARLENTSKRSLGGWSEEETTRPGFGKLRIYLGQGGKVALGHALLLAEALAIYKLEKPPKRSRK